MKKFVILVLLLVASATFAQSTNVPSAAEIDQVQIEAPQIILAEPTTSNLEDHVELFALARPLRVTIESLPSFEDFDCMQQNIYFEARGEGEEGMKAVAQVTLNRTMKRNFPKTVCGVVQQRSRYGCQFSWVCHKHKIPDSYSNEWLASGKVATLAFSGNLRSRAKNAIYYHEIHCHPRWALHMAKIGRIGNQIFYSG